MTAARSIGIVEVGPRDGLQNEAAQVPTPVKLEFIRRALDSGIRRIEVASFVSPRRVPQMADAEAIFAGLPRRDDVSYIGLVLNRAGFDRAVAAGCCEIGMVVFTTDEFNRRNQNASPEESLAAATAIVGRAHADGIRATVTIGVAFGCPFEGAVDPSQVLRYAEDLAKGGADEIVFADTVGVAVPRQVKDLVGRAVPLVHAVGVHLHNTRNTGFANAYAALEAGASVLDASVGGLGGCPFAPRATGNISTEDLVYMLHGEGVETGIDLAALIAVAEWLEGELGRELPGMVYRAGTFAPVAG